MGRAPCCDKANVKKGPWSPEEDAKLKAYIEKYGTGGNWIALPQKIGLKRCGKSCRLRWLNYLRPNIKHGGFTEEEDNIICSLYISIGSRWSIIAAQLPGRTDNDIKNYWNTRLKKKLLGRRKQSNTNRLSIPGLETKDLNHEDDNSTYNLQNLSSSALERLQLHMQLQNPNFSFYNNPALWPKNMIQTVHSQLINHNNQSSTAHLMAQINSCSPQLPPPVNDHFSSSESSFALNNDQSNLIDQSEIMEQNTGIEPGFTQAELDELINNKSSASFVPTGSSQIAENHDCFKDNNMGWWANEFDASSSSLNSWGSASLLHQSEEMYQDYVIGSYGMH